MRVPLQILVAASVAIACGDGDGDGDGETEIISVVELRFEPDGGGDAVVAKFEDPDGDGGVSGMSEPITLAAGSTYTLTVAFRNELVDPPEDITAEVAAEAEEHMVFFDGGTLAPYVYGDLESDYGDDAVGEDLPVGLAGSVTTGGPGTGTFRVVLRHLPPLNEAPQKDASLPMVFAAGEPLPGDVDADVEFALAVE